MVDFLMQKSRSLGRGWLGVSGAVSLCVRGQTMRMVETSLGLLLSAATTRPSCQISQGHRGTRRYARTWVSSRDRGQPWEAEDTPRPSQSKFLSSEISARTLTWPHHHQPPRSSNRAPLQTSRADISRSNRVPSRFGLDFHFFSPLLFS